jgi:hypothetical protein
LRLRLAAFLFLLAAATVALFLVSRGQWSDPLIDSGREWIVPDALSRGELLYRDVAYWFGPLTPYLHAAFFVLFGSSFTTLAAAGCLGAAAALAALFLALRRVAGETSGSQAMLWTALAIPALVFMPNAGGAILGMGFRIWHAATFGLLAIVVASGVPNARRFLGAGALAALAGLCRTEWGLAALSAVALVLVRGGRLRGGAALRALAILTAGFLLVFAGVWSVFLARVGWAGLADQPVFLLNIPEETRGHVGLAGLRAWRTGVWNLLYSAAVWAGIVVAIGIVALGRGETPAQRAAYRRRVLGLAAALVVAALCAAMGAVPGPVLFGAAPLVCLAALVAGWRGSAGSSGAASSAALAGFGWMGLLASHRRVFFLDDAPYVAPPLLFAFVCAGALLARAAAREASPASRARLSAAFVVSVGALVVLAFAGRIVGYASDSAGRVAIRGTGGMLSARPELARRIEDVAAAVRRDAPPGAGLAVFPEGELLNFLSGRPNPLRHKLYLPGYLTEANEHAVIEELERTRPAIVRWLRPTGEYARGLFGSDYGRGVAAWIDANGVATANVDERAGAHPELALFLPRRPRS